MMKMKTPRHKVSTAGMRQIVVCCLVVAACLTAAEAFARAGGGGGGGRGSGIGYAIALPYLLVHAAIVSYLLNKKNKECRTLLEGLRSSEKYWDPGFIAMRVNEVFFKVQEAWTRNDQSIARDYVSDALYAKHKLQTDQMERDNRRNVLERINLIESRVVEVADYADDARDRLWVYIKGSMIDYMQDTQTKANVSGNTVIPEKFTELWKFIRANGQWVLDEIDQKVNVGDLKGFRSFTEKK